MTKDDQIRFLAERLAISLMAHNQVMQEIVLEDHNEEFRKKLMDDEGYGVWLRAVRRALQAEKVRAELEAA